MALSDVERAAIIQATGEVTAEFVRYLGQIGNTGVAEPATNSYFNLTNWAWEVAR